MEEAAIGVSLLDGIAAATDGNGDEQLPARTALLDRTDLLAELKGRVEDAWARDVHEHSRSHHEVVGPRGYVQFRQGTDVQICSGLRMSGSRDLNHGRGRIQALSVDALGPKKGDVAAAAATNIEHPHSCAADCQKSMVVMTRDCVFVTFSDLARVPLVMRDRTFVHASGLFYCRMVDSAQEQLYFPSKLQRVVAEGDVVATYKHALALEHGDETGGHGWPT